MLIIAFSSGGCKHHTHDDHLAFYVDSACKDGGGKLNISAFKKVKWDTLYVIRPYTPIGKLPAQLLPYQEQIASTGIDQVDRFYVLLLTDQGKLTEMARIPAGLVDWARLDQHTGGNNVGIFQRDRTNFNTTYDVAQHRFVLSRP